MIRIGMDVGGTGIQIGAVNEEGKIIARSAVEAKPGIPFSEQIREMAECALSLIGPEAGYGISMDDVVSIGAGIPGIANSDGVVVRCVNLNWKNEPFRAEMVKHIHKPVFIDNDANVAALAENCFGVCAGASSSVFITVGTGIGSGIVLNGKIWSGAHGIGTELGHTIMRLDGEPCTCGNHGCLERYCSATAIIRMAREGLANHPESRIVEKCGGDFGKINARMVIDSAREGDPFGCEVYSRFISYLSQAIANVINFLDPEIIALGGGVSKAGDFLLNAVRAEYPKYVVFNDQPMPEVKLAVLGPDAGIIGAAMLS